MIINISIFTLALIVLLSIITVMQAAESTDPCSGELDHLVADMCTSESVVEDSFNGNKPVDSVMLRITKQQNNCICKVSLHETVSNYTVYMSKYNGLSSSAPTKQTCGLAVDVEYVDSLDVTRSLQPIECTSGTDVRSIVLDGNELILKSKIIGGTFIRGYCMQIFRNHSTISCEMNDQVGRAGSDGDWIETNGTQHSSIDACKRYCLQSENCKAVYYEPSYCFVFNQTTTLLNKSSAIYSEKHCVDTKLAIRCYPPETVTQTSQETASEDNTSTQKETVTKPIGDNTVTNHNTQSTTKVEKQINKDKKSDLYVYLGAAAGGVLMVLLIVFLIVCIRKRINHTPLKEPNNDSTKQFCSEARDSDNDYGGLKDNVLYVSSEPNDILEDGNYNTVDLEQTRKVDQDNNCDGNYSTVDGICNIIGSDSSLSKSKPVIKPKPKTSFKSGSVDKTMHLSTMDNSNNEYAIVDKERNSDDVKHINPVHGNDAEYAVVNKVKKSSNNH